MVYVMSDASTTTTTTTTTTTSTYQNFTSSFLPSLPGISSIAGTSEPTLGDPEPTVKQAPFSVAAVASTVVLSVAQLVTCGGLLLIFLLRRNTAKHASMIMISTLANVCLVAIADIAMRLPIMIIKESTLGATHPKLCIALTLTPDYLMIAILISLPLLSVERLIRLEAKNRLTSKQMRHLFGCLLVIAYSLALVVIILPTTNLFSAEVNFKCDKNLLYGYAFAYVYSGLTLLSVVITTIFSIAVIFRLKVKLSHLLTTTRKKIILKQGTVSAIVITGLLFFALVPFAASLQLVLMCASKEITNKQFCDSTLQVMFRICVIIHKLCLILLPIVFLGLNPSLRRKICLTLKRPKQMEHVVTISNSATVSKDSICDQGSATAKEEDQELDLEEDFITIAEDLTFGQCGDIKGEIKRLKSGSIRNGQSVLDLVDVMSIISERSEISRSYSNTFEE